MSIGRSRHECTFQFTHPMWGATREGGQYSHTFTFQFTHPMWGATRVFKVVNKFGGFQFTHPVWGATRYHQRIQYGTLVSIHAPRVGCDLIMKSIYQNDKRFNSRTPCGVRRDRRAQSSVVGVSIHAPRVGCDIFSIVTLLSIIWFQFTHPVWGATQLLFGSWLIDTSFNSRTPCGVRHSLSCNFYTSWSFNSRTPCGVRPDSSVRTWFCWWFQFTHPVWGATRTS